MEEAMPTRPAAWRLLLVSVFSSAYKESTEQLLGGFSIHFDSSDDLDLFLDTHQEYPPWVDALRSCGCLQGKCLQDSGLLRTVWDAVNFWITVEDMRAFP